MKKFKEEKIEMMRIENRRGAVLLRNQYETISVFIVNTLNEYPKNQIELNDLLELAHVQLDAQFYGNVPWFLLQVKQDLEARHIIKTSVTRNREQFITLGASQKKLLHSREVHSLAL